MPVVNFLETQKTDRNQENYLKISRGYVVSKNQKTQKTLKET